MSKSGEEFNACRSIMNGKLLADNNNNKENLQAGHEHLEQRCFG